jgi:hypothetical protein
MVATFAIMLMAVLVVRAPVVTVDRLLHATHHNHEANAFAGAIQAPDHHDGHHGASHEEPGDTSVIEVSPDDAASNAATTGPHHHHHHEAPSVYGLFDDVTLPGARLSDMPLFELNDDLRNGVEDYRRDRPPKILLAYFA